jgi:hypothetical protein
MAAITPTRIDNRLGTVISSPAATTNAGPTTGDIGADGATPTPASLMRVFDVTLTSGGSGDTATFAIPATIQKLAQPGGAPCGLGLSVTITPMNATARTGSPVMTQPANTNTVILTFNAAAAGAIYRIVFNGMFSSAR